MTLKCITEDCKKRASYNYNNEKSPKYCASHKKINMIDVRKEKCLEENCSKKPHFNLQDETKGIYCTEHKKENMIPSLTTFG